MYDNWPADICGIDLDILYSRQGLCFTGGGRSKHDYIKGAIGSYWEVICLKSQFWIACILSMVILICILSVFSSERSYVKVKVCRQVMQEHCRWCLIIFAREAIFCSILYLVYCFFILLQIIHWKIISFTGNGLKSVDLYVYR